MLLVALRARAFGAEGPAAEARANVRDVFARPEFQPLADADRLPDLPRIDTTWLDTLLDALRDVFAGPLTTVGKALAWLLQSVFRALGSLFRNLSGAGVAEGAGAYSALLLWILVTAAAALLVWLLVRLARASRDARAAGARALAVSATLDGEDDALARTPEDWRRRAERLAAAGDRVEALRALYLELLAGLHRLGAIDYDRTRTNTAYVHDVARGHDARAPFVALTYRFDRAVYGAHEPSAVELMTAMDDVDAVRGAFAREHAHE